MTKLLAETPPGKATGKTPGKNGRSLRGRLPSGQPNPVDVHLGNRLRLRRIMLGISQEELGLAVGLTFQQIQKYEYGLNRVGTSRLWDLSRALGCPVAYFFDEMDEKAAEASPRRLRAEGIALNNVENPDVENPNVENPNVENPQGPADPTSRREALLLVRAYTAIKKDSVRRKILDLAYSLSRPNP